MADKRIEDLTAGGAIPATALFEAENPVGTSTKQTASDISDFVLTTAASPFFTVEGNGPVTLDLGTITTDKRALYISTAFNNGAVDFAPVVIELLPGNAGANARALQVISNGSEVFGVAPNGNLIAGSFTGQVTTNGLAAVNTLATPTISINTFFDTKGWWGTTTDSSLVFYVNNQNESIVIDHTSYNVGIYNGPTGATSAPLEQLDVRGNIRTTGVVRVEAVNIANLPASPVLGMRATVDDGDPALAWGATVVNSGAGATPYAVWYNGTNWTVMGK